MRQADHVGSCIAWSAIALIAGVSIGGCSPKQVVTAPVQAVGQAAGAAARTVVPVAAGAAVGTVTANPAAGVAAGRATSGAVNSRSSAPASPETTEAEGPQ